MNKKIIIIDIVACALIVIVGIIVGVTFRFKGNEVAPALAADTEEPVMMMARSYSEEVLTEIEAGKEFPGGHLVAGIESVLEACSNILSDEEFDEEEIFESEYGNFAIAKVHNYVNVRSKPGTEGEVVGHMYDGSVAEILERIGEGDEEWLQVISGDVEGYIKSEYFIIGEEAEEVIEDYLKRWAVITADRLNVRIAPDTGAKRIGYILQGEKVKLLEADVTGAEGTKWLKVEYTSGKEGYISNDYSYTEEEFVCAKSIEEERAEQEARLALDEERLQREEEPDEAEEVVTEVPAETDKDETGIEKIDAQAQEGEENNTATEEISLEATAQPGAENASEPTAEPTAEPITEVPVATQEQVIPTVPATADSAQLRAAIIQYAMQYLGNRYINGGQSLAKGTDCSGFTCYIYREFGINLSRIPNGQWTGNGRRIDVSQIQPGDIVCYSQNRKKCSHVAIYIGNGQVIHSFNSRAGVVISNMYYDKTFMGVINVID